VNTGETPANSQQHTPTILLLDIFFFFLFLLFDFVALPAGPFLPFIPPRPPLSGHPSPSSLISTTRPPRSTDTFPFATMHLLRTLLALVPLLPSTLAWGAAGHEIVATIAQIHLHPSVKEKLCTILPAQAKCHLAPVAAWADQVRTRYPGTGPMHYINGECDATAPDRSVCLEVVGGWHNTKRVGAMMQRRPYMRVCRLPIVQWTSKQGRTTVAIVIPRAHSIVANDDHPPEKCSFGEHGWTDEDVNVLTAIMNMTQQVMDGRGWVVVRVAPILDSQRPDCLTCWFRDIPLRFLTHFVGDMHQPLHLCGRDKGGNGGECGVVRAGSGWVGLATRSQDWSS
jgi:hypothetical protein